MPLRSTISVTPVNFLVQFALLPLYLRLFIGESFIEIFAVGRIAVVFVTLIGLPLLAAFATERWAERRPRRDMVIGRLGWLPVPMLALVVFLIAGAQARSVADIVPVAKERLGLRHLQAPVLERPPVGFHPQHHDAIQPVSVLPHVAEGVVDRLAMGPRERGQPSLFREAQQP
jgi:hypothetical protein